jgi:hypothetical protein
MTFITGKVGRLDISLLDLLNNSSITFGYLISELINISVPSIRSILSLVSAVVVLLFNDIDIILLT